MTKIIIHIKGGRVTDVYANSPDVTVNLCDWDNDNIESAKQNNRRKRECKNMYPVF